MLHCSMKGSGARLRAAPRPTADTATEREARMARTPKKSVKKTARKPRTARTSGVARPKTARKTSGSATRPAPKPAAPEPRPVPLAKTGYGSDFPIELGRSHLQAWLAVQGTMARSATSLNRAVADTVASALAAQCDALQRLSAAGSPIEALGLVPELAGEGLLRWNAHVGQLSRTYAQLTGDTLGALRAQAAAAYGLPSAGRRG
ncbi:MAG TPA: phasin family protein [Kiloniellales bacterium]|nr:phasin family protein [Kiloniellales bacterium]